MSRCRQYQRSLAGAGVPPVNDRHGRRAEWPRLAESGRAAPLSRHSSSEIVLTSFRFSLAFGSTLAASRDASDAEAGSLRLMPDPSPGLTPWRRSVQPRRRRVRTSYPLRAPYPRLRGPSTLRSRPQTFLRQVRCGPSGCQTARTLPPTLHAGPVKAFTSSFRTSPNCAATSSGVTIEPSSTTRCPRPRWPGQKGGDIRADVARRDHGRFPVCRIVVDR